jgi:hypothetical protein
MWTATADKDLKKAFDDAIEIAYGNGRNRELENLANLFGDVALDNYQQALLKGLDGGSTAIVDVAWIDKRPIAKLSDTATGAELGDMMLVVNEYDPRGLQISRACLLEVKQSPTEVIPPVPVTSGQSTKNQFQILSTWPTLYGLKATGSNRDYLLENIITQPGAATGGVLAQAWYVAVKPASATTPTPMPWMAAPAEAGAPFEHTLGDIFGTCARGGSLTNKTIGTPIGVGREFEQGKTLQNPPGWDALINAIISVTNSYDLPEHYFPRGPGKRYIRGRRFAPFAALGGLKVPSGAMPTASGVLIGILIACATFAISKLFQARKRALAPDEAFPVLFFKVRHSENLERAGERG